MFLNSINQRELACWHFDLFYSQWDWNSTRLFIPADLVFQPILIIKARYSKFHFIIFYRWDLKLFGSSNVANQWNGKANNTGGICPDATRYYIFSANEPVDNPYSNKGFISLIRQDYGPHFHPPFFIQFSPLFAEIMR